MGKYMQTIVTSAVRSRPRSSNDELEGREAGGWKGRKITPLR